MADLAAVRHHRFQVEQCKRAIAAAKERHEQELAGMRERLEMHQQKLKEAMR